jgi:uncharacterized protein YndB with AHSA1/START domain
MPIVSSTQDPEARSFTIVAEFDAPPSRVWQIWVDPRQLERWWGPPTWPATFETHDVAVGGESSYYMTGPDGEKARGWWRFVTLDEPKLLEFDDGFSDDAGAPNPQMPTVKIRVELESLGEGTRMTIRSQFESAEQMKQLVDMGMVEGMTQAMGQIEGVLAS